MADAPTISDGIQLVGGIDALTGAASKFLGVASSVAGGGSPGGAAAVTGGAVTWGVDGAAAARSVAQLRM